MEKHPFIPFEYEFAECYSWKVTFYNVKFFDDFVGIKCGSNYESIIIDKISGSVNSEAIYIPTLNKYICFEIERVKILQSIKNFEEVEKSTNIFKGFDHPYIPFKYEKMDAVSTKWKIDFYNVEFTRDIGNIKKHSCYKHIFLDKSTSFRNRLYLVDTEQLMLLCLEIEKIKILFFRCY